MRVFENRVWRYTFTPVRTEDHYHYSSKNIVRVTTSWPIQVKSIYISGGGLRAGFCANT